MTFVEEVLDVQEKESEEKQHRRNKRIGVCSRVRETGMLSVLIC